MKKYSIKDVKKLADRYPLLIYWNQENDAYLAECPQLQGCRTHGDTYGDAAKNGREAIEVWLEGAIKKHQKFPEPIPSQTGRRRQMILRVADDFLLKLQALSRLKNRSINDLATELLAKGVEGELQST